MASHRCWALSESEFRLTSRTIRDSTAKVSADTVVVKVASIILKIGVDLTHNFWNKSPQFGGQKNLFLFLKDPQCCCPARASATLKQYFSKVAVGGEKYVYKSCVKIPESVKIRWKLYDGNSEKVCYGFCWHSLLGDLFWANGLGLSAFRFRVTRNYSNNTEMIWLFRKVLGSNLRENDSTLKK